MTDLTRLVAAPGANSTPYVDPVFPDRRWCCTPHGLANMMPGHRFCSCITASAAMAESIVITGSTWWTKPASWLSRSSSPRRRFPNIFGTIPAICMPKTARQTRAKLGPSALTRGSSRSCAREASLYTKAMDCSVTPRAASTSTECLSFGFRDRVAAAVSANAGTYAMPDLATPWPFGLGETNVDIGALRALLAFPITVTAGTEDILTTGQFFPKGPRSMRQGATRYERARNYVRSGHNAAAALQTSCAWTIIDVPGVGHDGKRMSAAAAPVVAAALRDGS